MPTKLTAGLRKNAAKMSNKESARLRRRAISQAGQELGEIPQPKNPERRTLTLGTFKFFLLTYFKERFYLPFSSDHDELCMNVQMAVMGGESSATAMPRSSGKTSIIELAPLWGYLNGITCFGLIIGATHQKAKDVLESIKTELLTSDLLLEDFPEICVPIRHIDNEPRRCKGQRHNGVRTGIEWSDSHIRLPYIAGRSPGGIIYADGMSAALRGLRRALLDGRVVRPDLVILDDPQTDDSAASPAQTAKRWNLIFGCIKGLQGAGKRLSIFAAVTIIRRGDLACMLLDQTRLPWRVIKAKSILSFPSDMDAWRAYHRFSIENKILGGSDDKLNDYYTENKEALEKDAIVSWPERITPGKVSALQGFMEYFMQNRKGFMAEHQQDPEADEEKGAEMIDPSKLARKVNGHKRMTVPPNCLKAVMYIDTHDNAFYWAILAADANATPYVLEYSTWPEQTYFDFTLKSIPRKLEDRYPDIADNDARIFRGGCDLVEWAVGKKLERWDGRHVTLDAVLADTGYKPEIWQKIRDLYPMITLTKGVGIGAKNKPMAEWDIKPDRQVGHHWVKQYTKGREHPTIFIDVNHWKTAVSNSMAMPEAQMGSLTLYGDTTTAHDLFASHSAAEKCVLVSANGRSVSEWQTKDGGGQDNHWFDCTVGCFMAFNILGLSRPDFKTVKDDGAAISMSAETRRRAFQ